MALRTVSDLYTAFLVRNNLTTTDTFITDATLGNFLQAAHNWAVGFRSWPMVEGRASTTFTSEETPIFEGWRADTTDFIQVGGYRYQKLNFEDYQVFREETPNSTERFFSDFGRLYFVNPNGTSGTLVAYGQYVPVLDVTDTSATTIFSGYEDEGNEAIVEYMTGLLKRREHALEEMTLQEKIAAAKLDGVWARVAQEQTNYHSNRGMWKRIDIVNGGLFEDNIKRDQF